MAKWGLLRAAGVLVAAALLSACGGGGGSSGGGTPYMFLSGTSLSFTAAENDATPVSQKINATVGNASSRVYLGVYYSENGIANVEYAPNGNSVDIWVYPRSPATLTPGIYTDTVDVLICTDENCNGHVRGSPAQFSVSYTVTGVLSVSQTMLRFSHAIGDSNPAAQTVSLSGNNLAWTATANQPWIELGASNGSTPSDLVISVDPAGLATGIHTGAVTVSALGGNTRTIAVQLEVGEPSVVASPSTLAFDHVYTAGVAPASKILNLNGLGTPSWTAAVSHEWITLSATTGTVPGPVEVSVDPAGLAIGNHAGSITFTNGATGGTVNVPVSVSVAAPTLSVPQNNLIFSHVLGSSSVPAQRSLTLNTSGNPAWSASADASWLVLGAASGQGAGALTVDVNPGGLASGTHSGIITVTNDVTGDTDTVEIALTITRPVLSASPSTVTLGGSDGMDLSSRQVVLSLSTGSSAHAWLLSSDTAGEPAWIAPDVSAGIVSADSQVVNVGLALDGMQGGTYSGTLTFTADVLGEPVTATVNVELKLEAQRIQVHDNGVAFASTPTTGVLSRTVRVSDSFGGDTLAWQASADQPWLSVTPSGTTADGLVLTADPAGLAVDALHRARVTVSSSDARIENQEIIEVGLWVGSADPTSRVLSVPLRELATDPVRPYAYAHNGGADISIYNVYTAALEATIAGVGTALGNMAVSGDGRMLYVLDNGTSQVIPVDLETRTVQPGFALAVLPRWMAYARSNGQPVLILSSGSLLDAGDGSAFAATYWGSEFNNVLALDASQDGSLFCIVPRYSALKCWGMRYSSVNPDGIGLSLRGDFGSEYWDVAINHDGSRVYAARFGYPDAFPVFDGEGRPVDELMAPEWFPNNVEVDADGRAWTAIHNDHWEVANDLWVYDEAGGLIQAYGVQRVLTRQLKISGDARRFVAISGSHITNGGTGNVLEFGSAP